MRHAFISLCFITSLALISCGQRHKADESHAQIKLSLPSSFQSVSAQGPVITRIMINITGAGIDPALVWICEQHDGGICPQNGGSVSLIVPRGSSRLVQVLVVLENGDQESIYYGDQSKDLAADMETVVVNVTTVGAANKRDIQLTGRYLTSATDGPTGFVDIYYEPVGKPAMMIEHSYIASGWFDLFAKEDMSFRYRLRATGELLDLSYNWAQLDLSGVVEKMRIQVPTHYSCHSGASSCDTQAREAAIHMIGFFGPGATGKKACYDDAGGDLSGQYLNIVAGAGSSPLAYVANAPSATEAGPTGGGLPFSSCTGTPYVDVLKLVTSQLGWGNGAQSAGYDGFYRLKYEMLSSHDTPVLWTGDPRLAEIHYLPSITVSGSDLFYKVSTGPGSTLNAHSKIPCSLLESQHGYTRVPFVYSSADIYQAATAVTASAEVDLYVCPYQLGPEKTYLSDLALNRSTVSYTPPPPSLYSTPGSYSFTVPMAGCSQVHIQSWGGGGGGGSSRGSTFPGGEGGGAAFAEGYFAVVGGQVLDLTVATGGGGGFAGVPMSPTPGGGSGGGSGGYSTDAGSSAGGGGGFSGVLSGGVMWLIAAGGGGGGAGGMSMTGAPGGAGGASVGLSSFDSMSISLPNQGGTQVSGGTHIISGACNGSSFLGGSSVVTSSGFSGGGGGGAGYFGGACGNKDSSRGEGGGGGSSYLNALGTSLLSVPGTASNPGNGAHPDRMGAGSGQGGLGASNAASGLPGTAGLIKVRCL